MPSTPAGRAPITLTQAEVDGLRAAQVELLAEFDRVCRAHELSYFALYGTALGAVRHQGFIPWDEDLDVGMLRADFDRLTTTLTAEFGDRYFLQTVDTDPAFGCMFAKLRKNGTLCVDRDGDGSAQHNGIFIDIFPLDAKAAGTLSAPVQKALRYVGFRLLFLKARYRFMTGTSPVSRTIQAIAKATVRLIPRPVIIAFTRLHTRFGRRGTPGQYVSLFGAYPYDRDIVDADWILPLTELPFESTKIPAFANYDGYLSRLYGDYMQPPPPQEQYGHHHLVEVDLGE